jgi:DNA repair exonuclease SbcCD ATPase subunit
MIQKIEHLEKKLVEYDKIAEAMRQELNGMPESHIQSTHYSTLAEAYVHQTNVNNLIERLDERYNATDPYEQQIQELSNTALQEVSWVEVNRLNHNLKHQELLLKLLTHRDSFVRKRIIDQNLSHLNNRLSYYLDKMGLPHSVTFQNDLTVEITQMGRDLDFDNLSRGERNRLILSLSWTFRDVYESMYKPVNFMLVDELIDNGLDPSGVESALKVLKTLNVERNKTILLISHRDELHGRVSSVLKVIKERGFTTFLS